MDVYGHLFEGDHRHVINLLLDNAKSRPNPQPLRNRLLRFHWRSRINSRKISQIKCGEVAERPKAAVC